MIELKKNRMLVVALRAEVFVYALLEYGGFYLVWSVGRWLTGALGRGPRQLST